MDETAREKGRSRREGKKTGRMIKRKMIGGIEDMLEKGINQSIIREVKYKYT